MNKEHSSRQPYYAQIAEELMREIRSGLFPPGTFIPTEPELGRRFSVSRVTVRGALRELEVRGMISRHRGIGTRVVKKDPQSRFIHDATSIEDLLKFSNDLEFQLLGRREMVVDEALAERLNASIGDRYVRIEGLRLPPGSDLPVCLSAYFVQSSYAGILENMDGQRGSVPIALSKIMNKSLDEVEQTIDAINLDKKEASVLYAKARDSALSIWSKYKDAEGHVMLASRTIYPKDRSSYSLRLSRSLHNGAVANGNRVHI